MIACYTSSIADFSEASSESSLRAITSAVLFSSVGKLALWAIDRSQCCLATTTSGGDRSAARVPSTKCRKPGSTPESRICCSMASSSPPPNTLLANQKTRSVPPHVQKMHAMPVPATADSQTFPLHSAFPRCVSARTSESTPRP